jgi:hypothetical protein
MRADKEDVFARRDSASSGGLIVYVVLSVADFRGDGWHGRRCHWRTDTDLAGDCVSDPEGLLPSKEINFKSKQWAALEDRGPLTEENRFLFSWAVSMLLSSVRASSLSSPE